MTEPGKAERGVNNLKDYRKIEPEYGLPIDHGQIGRASCRERV